MATVKHYTVVNNGRDYYPPRIPDRLISQMDYNRETTARRYTRAAERMLQIYPELTPAQGRLGTFRLRWHVDFFMFFYPSMRPFVRGIHEQVIEMSNWHLAPTHVGRSVGGLLALMTQHRRFVRFTPNQERQDFGGMRASLAKRVFAYDGKACVRCGKRFHLHVDHIWPVRFGGANYGVNFQTLCSSCNHWKNKQLWFPGLEHPVDVSAFHTSVPLLNLKGQQVFTS